MLYSRLRSCSLFLVIACALAVRPAVAGITTSAAWTYEPNQANAHFGGEVAPAGDVNGDGISDVIVGSGNYSAALTNEGRAWVFFGAASIVPLATTPSWTLSGGSAAAFFGCSVGCAGDVNGDGYSDIVVGSYGAANGQLGEGRAYVYHGGASGPSLTPNWTTESNVSSANYGYKVCGAGDVNGDGFDDVLVSAYSFSSAISLEGKVYLYLGSASGLATVPVWTAQGGTAGVRLGETLSPAGDVNADGFADFLVGLPSYSNGQSAEGAVRVYLGNATGVPTLLWQAESNVANARFGRSLAAAGDYDGDLYADILIGDATPGASHAKLYRGAASGPGTAPAVTWTGTSTTSVGASVATAGDVNGDGRADLLLGDPLEDFFITNIGAIRVFDGSANLDPASPTQMVFGATGGAGFGASARCAGDVNGDGFGDVIVGASETTNGQSLEGRATLYLGTGPTYAASSEGPHVTDLRSVAEVTGLTTAHGDMNGDGIADLIMTHEEVDHSFTARLYAGGANGFETAPPLNLPAITDSAAIDVGGVDADLMLCVVGDVNGDGYEDLVAGDPSWDEVPASNDNRGRIRLLFGGPSGFAHAKPWDRLGPGGNIELYGFTVTPAGDTNGDGFADFLVGGGIFSTYLELLLGGVEGPSQTPGWVLRGTATQPLRILYDRACGDFNGDGYSDWAVSVNLAALGDPFDRRVFEFHGGPVLPDSTPYRVLSPPCGSPPCAGDWSHLASADVNGDGYADLIVGDPDWNGTLPKVGRIYLHLGGPNGISSAYSWTQSLDPLRNFGDKPAALGDLNGDGYDDFGVAQIPESGTGSPTTFYIYFGGPAGPVADSAWVIRPPAGFGFSVLGTTGGGQFGGDDFDGDGLTDVFLQSGGADRSCRGSVYLGCGLDSPGKFRRFRQRRPDNTRTVSYLGNSGGANDVLLGAIARTPAGRGAVRLEAQVRGLGATWAGSTLTSSFSNSGSGSTRGVALSLPVSGLAAGGRYHWRARLRTRSAEFPTTPWFSPTRGNRRETDFRVGVPVAAIDDEPAVPGRAASLSGAPNPFRSAVRLRLSVSAPTRASFAIHDVTGRIVYREPARSFAIGDHEWEWDGRRDDGQRATPGVYWARIAIGDRAITQRLVLLK